MSEAIFAGIIIASGVFLILFVGSFFILGIIVGIYRATRAAHRFLFPGHRTAFREPAHPPRPAISKPFMQF